MTRFMPVVLLLIGFGTLPVAEIPAFAQDPLPAAIPLEEISRGMRGYGLTVFADSRIDTFAVEVVGVQSGVRANGSLILVEVSGHGLETSSIAQGMSGSPVFLEGRFAGALAFGWGGALRPLAGVTPAHEILGLPTHSHGTRAAFDLGTEMPGFSLESLMTSAEEPSLGAALWGEAEVLEPAPLTSGQDWPEAETLIADLLAQAMGKDAPAMGEASSPWFLRPLGMATAGVSGQTSAPPLDLAPGSACAVPLITGDAQLGAIGTVTWVDGENVYMMGHPFMQRGPVNLPLATAHIHTIFPSRQLSFKLGSVGDIVGTVFHDQRAGLSGRLGAAPAMVPVQVSWQLEDSQGQLATRDYKFQVVDDAQLTGPLVFWTLYNSLLVEGDDASRQNLRYDLVLEWEDRQSGETLPAVELSGQTAGPGGAGRLATEWMAPVNVLLNNPFVHGRLTGVQARMETSRPQALARIESVTAPRMISTGDQQLVCRVEMSPWHGDRESLEVTLDLPPDLKPGSYRLAVASAAEMFALEAQRAPGSLQVASLNRMLEVLGTDRDASTLVVALFARGSGMMISGREMTGLPGRVSRLIASGNMEVKPVMADLATRSTHPTAWLLQGHAVRNIKVASGPETAPQERRP